MARICTICQKRPMGANLVSHANNRVKRWVYPNTHVCRFICTNDPLKKVVRAAVCTKCLKAGKIQKVL